MIKHINSIEYAYNKIILESKQTVICQGWFTNLIDKTKNTFNKLKNFADNAVGSFKTYLVGLYNLIKFGILMLTRMINTTYKKDPKIYANDSEKLQTNLYIVLPFFKTPMSVIDNAGKQTHNKEFKELKDSLKSKNNKQYNIDQSAKSLGKSLWSRAKQPFINAVTASTSEAKKKGQQLQDSADKSKQKITQKIDKTKQVTKEDINFINEQSLKYLHNLHALIIDWVYKGLTPKIIMENIDNDFSDIPQGDIIIENNLLSFKTHNGQLICEQTNLKTKDIIIYESNCPFKGYHLIYEDTIGQMKQFNNIITQEDEHTYNTIISEQINIFQIMTIISIAMTVIGLITLIKQFLLTPLHAATCGTSIVAAEATKPVQAAGGSIAGNATVIGTQQVGKQVAKATIKTTLKNAAAAVKKEGLKQVAKKTAKQAGKQAIKHPVKTAFNAINAHSVGTSIKDAIVGQQKVLSNALADVKIDPNLGNKIDIDL